MREKISTRLLRKLHPESKPYEVFDTEVPGFFLRVQPSGVMTYYLVYRNAEGRQRRYRIARTTDMSPVQARDHALLKRGEVAGGVDVHAARADKRQEAALAKTRTLRGFLEAYYAPWASEHLADPDAHVRRVSSAFAEFLDKPMADLNQWLIDKWRTRRLNEGRRRSTVNRDLSALRGCLSRAVSWGVLAEHPLQGLKPLKVDKAPKVRYLSNDEAKRLREALEARDTEAMAARDRANVWRRERDLQEMPSLSKQRFSDHLTPLVLVSLNTGIRRGEAFKLQWSDVDLQGRMLTVRGESAKSSHTRHIPLNDEAFAALVAWRNQTMGQGLVWPGKEGASLDNVKKSWAAVLKAARIEAFRWHDLRHTFASWMVMGGVPLNTVRDLLGHADFATTLRYAHLAPAHKADAVAQLAAPA